MLYPRVETAKLGVDLTGGIVGALSAEEPDGEGPIDGGGELIDGVGAIEEGVGVGAIGEGGDELIDGVGAIDGLGVVGTMVGEGEEVGVIAGVIVMVGDGAPPLDGGIVGDADGV
ncbi:hypothetical protein PVK06_003579 [Gossypium arboreum]|uniref:Uncharacterized protein n=1 Tax=Gossypium arboreum TaxID=29729 RepID=A0ABR0R6Z3_GOSAR|nr:hypothetical protein PVK06_003579 [Gossypium arboreum]